MLNNHNRLDLLRAVAAGYRDIHDERSRRLRVKVRAAAPLSAQQQERLKAGLRDAGQAARNLELVASVTKPEGFFDPKAPGGTGITTSRSN